MLSVHQVSKSFGSTRALTDISVDFKDRHSYGILGSSGSGKSTLLKILLGILVADHGVVQLDQQNIEAFTPRERAQRIGYVPQDAGLFPHMSARENVSITARALGWSQEKIETRIGELAPLLSVEASLLERFPRQMSGGQKQRMGILRAAFLNPEILVLDEPLGALDPIIRRDLQIELKDIFKSLGKTVVLVTHDLAEAAYLSEEILLMHEGRIVQRGTFEVLRDQPLTPFVKKFFSAQVETILGSRA